MKKVWMMYLPGCPHCKKAREMIASLQEEYTELKDIPIRYIDETVEKELADSLDYYYVPTIYVDGVKMMEGVPTLEQVHKALKAAIE